MFSCLLSVACYLLPVIWLGGEHGSLTKSAIFKRKGREGLRKGRGVFTVISDNCYLLPVTGCQAARKALSFLLSASSVCTLCPWHLNFSLYDRTVRPVEILVPCSLFLVLLRYVCWKSLLLVLCSLLSQLRFVDV